MKEKLKDFVSNNATEMDIDLIQKQQLIAQENIVDLKLQLMFAALRNDHEKLEFISSEMKYQVAQLQVAVAMQKQLKLWRNGYYLH